MKQQSHKFHYAGSELAPNMFGASSELVRSWFEAEIWPII